MKLLILFIFLVSFKVVAQEPINERYSLDYDASIFGNIIATDSCLVLSFWGQ